MQRYINSMKYKTARGKFALPPEDEDRDGEKNWSEIYYRSFRPQSERTHMYSWQMLVNALHPGAAPRTDDVGALRKAAFRTFVQLQLMHMMDDYFPSRGFRFTREERAAVKQRVIALAKKLWSEKGVKSRAPFMMRYLGSPEYAARRNRDSRMPVLRDADDYRRLLYAA